MMKHRSTKNHIVIRKRLRLLGCLSLVLLLSLFFGGRFFYTRQVQAAEVGNPLFKMSLEEYLKKPVNKSYTWENYSNEDNVSREKRVALFADYFRTQVHSSIANEYGLPIPTDYDKNEVDVDHNATSADSGHDLYLLEFSTANEVKKPDIDIYYSVYFIQQVEGKYKMRFTDAVELSKDSRDFLERDDRNQELRKGELEMTTIQIPKGAVPVGVFVWQEGQDDDKCAWELSYLNLYKLDSISDVIVKHLGENPTFSNLRKPQHNYRTYTGTLVGTIDSESIGKNYMGSKNGTGTNEDGTYFEWLYPLAPAKQEVSEYVIEVITKGPRVVAPRDSRRTMFITFEYTMNSGSQGYTPTFEISPTTLYSSHPFVAPEDYDGFYAFESGDNFINSIAMNTLEKKDLDLFMSHPTGYPNGYYSNNKVYRVDTDMQDIKFWTLPSANNYHFSQMNSFAGMMLGNFFDADTMATSYLKEYRAVQMPITLPTGIKEFTKISTKPHIASGSYSYNKEDPNANAGIQSIRLIRLAEPYSENNAISLTSNGFFSSEPVLPVKGRIVAETQGIVNTYQGNWSSTDPTYKLINYTGSNQKEVNTTEAKFQGITVTFSDTFGAGIDHLLADVVTKFPDINILDFPTNQAMIYVMDDQGNPDNLGLPLYNLLKGYYRDPLTLTVTYYDQFDDIREVDIPFVTAYLMQLIMDSKRVGENDPSTWISGVFQQGQTVGLRLNLSEFKSMISIRLSYGYGGDNPLTAKMRSMEGDADYSDNDSRRAPMKYNLSKDSIAIDNICFYNSVTPSNFTAKYNGKTLTPTINTSLTPSCSWQAATKEGQVLSEDRSFTAYHQSREGSTVNMIEGGPIKDDYKDKYLIEITTLNTPLAGTVSNLTYQLHYTDTYGTARSTTVGGLQGAARDFYGNSSYNLNVDSTDFQSKVQYVMHLTAGSKFCFVTEIENLKQFDGITLSSDGIDEWQPEQIRILKLTSLSERFAARSGAFIGNLSATDIPDHLKPHVATNLGLLTYQWDRNYDGTVLASAAPNLLLHQGKTSARVNFTHHNSDGTTVDPDTVIEDVQYMEKIPTSMTYEDTLVDLGLNVVKNTYQVNIDVANVTDAGSSNYFYFQLIFENGKSGLVLANQQLPSDSFRQGLTETFSIQTTQRYGDVKAVRIICEATASTANTFDKLNIDKITVTLNSKQGTGKSWIVDRVGWVDINYVDEVQQSYATGDNVVLENKDLTLDFPITSVSSSAELMFCISTAKQSDSTAATLNMASLGNQIEGVITYTDFQNSTRTINLNIPQKIMDFNENESASRLLKSGSMDRFIVTLPDVKQINSLALSRNEGKNGDWVISDISVQKVGGVGDVYLSSYTGEYIRNIDYSEYLTKATTRDVHLGMNDTKVFHFDPHTIEADISSEDNNAWNTTITRYPVSSDESLNIYVYLANANGEPYQLSEGDYVDASVIYSSSMGTGALKASFKNIRAQSTTEGSSLLFAQALPIQSVGSLKSMEIRGSFSGRVKPMVRCAYIEHVQGNVIKDTLYVPFNNASMALDKVSANISSLEALTPMKQIVRLQPKEGTSSILTPESSDIAVALRYTSSLDPEKTKMVYQSPYVFLTDVDYMILDNREHIEVPFYIHGVGEIVGLTVISSGPIVEFENALITNYPKPTTTDGKENPVTTLLGSCNIAEGFVSSNIASKMMKTSQKVTPVTFTFTTPKEDLVAGGGTSGQVGMLITYTDSENKQQTYRINNILDYLPLDNPPFSDTVTSFNILMTDVAYLNSVTLTPATDDWFLAEVNAKVTTYEDAKQTTVNKTAVVNQWAKADSPLTIDMRPDSVNTDGPVINKITGFSLSASAEQSKVSASATSGNALIIKVVAGDVVTFTPTFQKVGTPTTNINWSAYKYEQFFTDYNDGSATFAVPSEDLITSEGLPRQYSLSAVCSENNSLAIPITIDVVSQEDLDNAKDGTAKLTIMTLQGGKTISTATYNESEKVILEVPADTAGAAKENTIFKFATSVDKENALFNVNDSSGLISPGSDGAYELNIPAGTTDVSNYYLMFNVADTETETTYTITVSTKLIKEETPAETITVSLKSDSETLAQSSFEEGSLVNSLSYSSNSTGTTMVYDLASKSSVTNISYLVEPVTSSYADEIMGSGWTSNSSNASLFTIPTLEVLKEKLGSDGQLPDSSNGTISVPFEFEVTVTIPDSDPADDTDDEKIIHGVILITVDYSDTTATTGTSNSTTSSSDTGGNSTGTNPGSSQTESSIGESEAGSNSGSASGSSSDSSSSTGNDSTNGSASGSSSDSSSSTGSDSGNEPGGGSDHSSTSGTASVNEAGNNSEEGSASENGSSNESGSGSDIPGNATDNGLPSAGVGSI